MTVLLFISTIVAFLTVDYFVRRNKAAVPAVQPVLRNAIPMRAPAGIFFSKNHTWMSLFPSGKVQLGIDDFLARMFSTPTITLLKHSADPVMKGEPILRVSEGNNELIVRSPIDGTVEKLNGELVKRPSLLSEALFSEGWAYTISPNSTRDLRGFAIGDESRTWLRNETTRLRDFFATLAGPAPAFLQDGGMPECGIMDRLNPEQCKRFEREFLTIE